MRTAKVITFLACREVQRIANTRPPEYSLLAPTINWWATAYPALVQLGLFVEFTEADGAYVPRIDVYDSDGELVARLADGSPFVSRDPVAVHCIALEQAALTAPRPGLYDLVLFFNGEEVARRQLWVNPTAATS